MKNLILSCFAVVLCYTLTLAQNKETRNVSTFSRIAFAVPGKAYIKQGSPQKVEIEGSKDALERVITEVQGDKLVIRTPDKWYSWNWGDEKVTVYITVKDINALSVSGSGDLIAQTKIVTGNLDLRVSGSGSLEAEIDAADVDADVSGSGDMDLKGKCKSFNSDISGSGKVTLNGTIAGEADIDISGSGRVVASGTAQSVRAEITGSGKVLASNLQTEKCNVRMSGSGDVEINVSQELDVRISGSGSVSYKGNPSKVNSDTSGSGRVRKM